MKIDMYTIVFSEDAKKDLKELQKKAPQALTKLSRLLDELREHPRTGTGLRFDLWENLPEVVRYVAEYQYVGETDSSLRSE